MPSVGRLGIDSGFLLMYMYVPILPSIRNERDSRDRCQHLVLDLSVYMHALAGVNL